MRWTLLSKPAAACASAGNARTAASKCGFRTMAQESPALRIFLCRFSPPSREALASVWFSAGRSPKLTAARSHSKIVPRIAVPKLVCAFRSIIRSFARRMLACRRAHAPKHAELLKAKKPAVGWPPTTGLPREKFRLLLLLLLRGLRIFFRQVRLRRVRRDARSWLLVARQEGHERRHFERHLLACRKQRNRFRLHQLDVIVPRVELDARAHRKCGYLINLRGIQRRSCIQ